MRPLGRLAAESLIRLQNLATSAPDGSGIGKEGSVIFDGALKNVVSRKAFYF
jgi:hypothetical protein